MGFFLPPFPNPYRRPGDPGKLPGMKAAPFCLARYECHPEGLDRLPVDWARVFGRRAPLAAEVGFGNGEYLAWRAAQEPAWDFVGLERSLQCTARAARRLAAAGLPNVRLVRGDARALLRELFPTSSLRSVMMQFPMPWPKERHAKHRIAGPAWVATLADVLAPGASFECVTDQEWFAVELHADLRADGAFAVEPVEAGPVRPFWTRYEQRWMARGHTIQRVAARLSEPRPVARLCLENHVESFHLPAAPGDAVVMGLAGTRYRAGEAVGEVKEVFRGPGAWLLRVVAADGSFSQVFFLRLRCGERGALLKVEDHPRPYATPGVRLLLRGVAAALGGETAGSPPGAAARPTTGE